MATLSDLRRATCRALLDGQKGFSFVIDSEDHIYPRHFHQVLPDPDYISIPEEETSDGHIHCCALWDDEIGCGLLLHRHDRQVICAFLSIISRDAA